MRIKNKSGIDYHKDCALVQINNLNRPCLKNGALFLPLGPVKKDGFKNIEMELKAPSLSGTNIFRFGETPKGPFFGPEITIDFTIDRGDKDLPYSERVEKAQY